MSTNSNNRTVEAYLFFNGNCEEAVAFYQKAIGAEVTEKIRFSESPDPAPRGVVPEGFENKIMHCRFRVGNTSIMASDGCKVGSPTFEGFSLTITVMDEADADRVFNALAEGGRVAMPPGKTFWSPRFGMLTDQFGVQWMINTLPKDQQQG